MTKVTHVQSLGQVVDVSPVLGWLRSLGLERYEEAFVREEIDWDSLKWLTEEVSITGTGSHLYKLKKQLPIYCIAYHMLLLLLNDRIIGFNNQ